MKNKLFKKVICALISTATVLSAGLTLAVSAEETETAKSTAEKTETAILIPSELNGQWGYVDDKEYVNVIIEPIYSYAGEMINGVAVVAKTITYDMVGKLYEGKTVDRDTLYLLKADGTEIPLYCTPNTAVDSASIDNIAAVDGKLPAVLDSAEIKPFKNQIQRANGLIVISNNFGVSIFKENGEEIIITDPNSLVSYTVMGGLGELEKVNPFAEAERLRQEGKITAAGIITNEIKLCEDGSIIFIKALYRPIGFESITFKTNSDGVVTEIADKNGEFASDSPYTRRPGESSYQVALRVLHDLFSH